MKLLSLLLVSAAHLALVQASAQGNGFGLSNVVQRTSYVTPETPPATGGQSNETVNGGSSSQTSPTTAPATPAPTTAHPTTSQCSDACGSRYQPVCGSDGKTYPSECTLLVASCKNPELNLTVQSSGECAKGSGVAQGTPPSSGGDTVSPSTAPGSSGSATPAPTTTASVTSTCKKACSKIRKPVCGSDGAMYSNLCLLKNAQCDNPKTEQVADDKCSSTSTSTGGSSTSTSTSISGSKGPVTSIGGSDSNVDQCTTMCTMELDPVCGSDGKTYSNPCALKNAQCKNPKGNIVVQAAGECKAAITPGGAGSTVNQGSTTGGTDSSSNCPSVCTADYNPVCGSDGKTYSNKCQLSIAKCNSPASNISLKSEGGCATETTSPGSPTGGSSSTTTGSSTSTSDSTATSGSSTSTSGNTGTSTSTGGNSVTTGSSTTTTTTTGSATTTGSSTSGNTATGIKQSVPTEPIKVASSKCEMACTKQYAPVCGSNGETYSNSCALKLANCKSSKKEITIRSEGACVKPSTSTLQKPSGATSTSSSMSTTTSTSGSVTPASGTVSSPGSASSTTTTTSKGAGTTTSTTTGTTGNTGTTGASTTTSGKGTYLRGPSPENSPVQGSY